MKKCLTFNDHATLQQQLKCMRSEMKEREIGIKSDAKQYVSNLPKKIFMPNKHKSKSYTSTSNSLGKFIAKGVNKTILKKEGFITKLLAGIFIRGVGKKVENRLIK